MEIEIEPRTGSERNALTHRDKLGLTKRLCRQLTGIIERASPEASGQTSPSESGGRDRVLDLVALALLGARGLAPASLDSPRARNMLRELSQGKEPVRDPTTFATRLTSGLPRALWLERSASVVSESALVFKQPWVAELLRDALLPGWIFQCLGRRPRAEIVGVKPGANAQSAGAKDIFPELLPELTQWFTPQWIADFLAGETIDKFLQSGFGSCTEARFLDPACGAGHMLVPALKKLVAESSRAGAQPSAVALSHALEHQVLGCDIDPRMVDLSGFSLYLAAREIVPNGELPLPQLFHFGLGDGQKSETAAIGSLWLGLETLPDNLTVVGPAGKLPLKQSPLAGSFSVIATNPPFLSHRLIPQPLSDFLRAHYGSGRFDLYTAFLSLCLRLLSEGGQMGMICQQSFMSISRYRKLREELLGSCDINGLIQLGPGAFGSVSGEKINSAIILAGKRSLSRRADSEATVNCWRVLDPTHKAQAEINGIQSLDHFEIARSQFATASGASFSFWCPKDVMQLFQAYPPLHSTDTGIECTNGLFTCNNELFVRLASDVDPREASQWVAYDKGGGHKWYRTTPYLLNWGVNGQAIRDYRVEHGQSASLPGERYYFQPGITYSYIGTKGFRARLLSPNSAFDIASSAIFSARIDLFYLLGFLNSSLARFLLGVLNPTINFQIGDLRRLPFAVPEPALLRNVAAAARKAVSLAVEVETFDPLSPMFSGPALLRYGRESIDKVHLKRAYTEHLEFLHEVNTIEAECQSQIDRCIFELYEIARPDQKLIYEDPWVARTAKELAAKQPFEHCLSNLIAFIGSSASVDFQLSGNPCPVS